MKFLGLILHQNLKFKKHIANVCKKVISNLFMLQIMVQCCERNIMKLKLYHALVIPHIKYGFKIIWGDSK